ncbi:MAG: hypothetical protein GY928_33970 [Colwellia sp.]|nr:hypothetical protein [Colwellia sp.]
MKQSNVSLLKDVQKALEVGAKALIIASDWNIPEVQVNPPKRWGLDSISEDKEDGWCGTYDLSKKLKELSMQIKLLAQPVQPAPRTPKPLVEPSLKADDFIKNKEYIPEFLKRDEHQAALFKFMDSVAEHKNRKGLHVGVLSYPNWLQAHSYVIDILLPVLAYHGYTIQKVHGIDGFGDIEETIKDQIEEGD